MRFTSKVFGYSFLCRISAFLGLLDGGHIQDSSSELRSVLTSKSSLFCCVLKNGDLPSVIS